MPLKVHAIACKVSRIVTSSLNGNTFRPLEEDGHSGMWAGKQTKQKDAFLDQKMNTQTGEWIGRQALLLLPHPPQKNISDSHDISISSNVVSSVYHVSAKCT